MPKEPEKTPTGYQFPPSTDPKKRPKPPKVLPCRACGREISVKVSTCPHCGEPYRGRGIPIFTWIILALLFVPIYFIVVNILDRYTNYERNLFMIVDISALWMPVIAILNLAILIAITSKRN